MGLVDRGQRRNEGQAKCLDLAKKDDRCLVLAVGGVQEGDKCARINGDSARVESAWQRLQELVACLAYFPPLTLRTS